jgi:hypothetical protein
VNAGETSIPLGFASEQTTVVWRDSRTGRMVLIPLAEEVVMQRIGEMFHHRSRDDFGEGDHQEYVESGIRDVLLVGGAAALLIGAFVASLI